MAKRASQERLHRLAEVIYSLPADAKTRLLASVREQLAAEGRDEQLAFVLDLGRSEPVQSPSTGVGPCPMPSSNHRERRIAFGWYGGKFSHLGWLLPLLPKSHHYCEPFGGSAAVLINREPSPVETYNDIDGEVVNFFRVLRDNPGELLRVIALTPFSREEFALAISGRGDSLEAVERARRFFVRARQVRTGLAQTASIGRWANCKNTSRAGMSGAVSRWLGSVEGLSDIVERLLRVQIENRAATEVVTLYDSEDTLFYCDPPYLHETRGDSKAYKYEMTEQEHKSLSRAVRSVKGLVAVSGYRCSLMDDLYEGWRCVEAPEKNCHSVKKPRMEALWMNYDRGGKRIG